MNEAPVPVPSANSCGPPPASVITSTFPTEKQEAGATGYVPRGQVVALSAQVDAPATLYKPGAQAKQEAGALANVPAGHDAAVNAQVVALVVL